MSKTNQKGFTLVEIAIVLVIIGLLLGGVMKGQELITNAKIKSVVSDARGMTAAIYTYQDRYGVLAGDDANATTNLNDPTLINGNGNGALSGAELPDVFAHLRAAGIIKGSGGAYPSHAFGETMYVRTNIHNLRGTVVCFENIEASIAHIIDLKEDDGIANKGSIQGSTAQANYTTSSTYLLCMRL